MEDIKIKEKKETETGWEFLVQVGNENDVINYVVTLETVYWEKLTSGQIEPEKLIEKSFKFLLERESKESILKEFNLQLINKYFPEYEEEINKN